jgi:hypothetical protein
MMRNFAVVGREFARSDLHSNETPFKVWQRFDEKYRDAHWD